jgi:6-pyruvoyltetrahydropterin/6-carboxytetrahydropterin synthase
MIVTKKVRFSAAHFLPLYEGKCKNLHGHTWIVEVATKGEVDEKTGMVVDFSWLKEVLQENVVEVFDHSLINDILINPTAENIAQHIYNILSVRYFNIKLAWVRVWESEDSMVEYNGVEERGCSKVIS